MSTKRALITGITGQDGGYLAELLLGKGYDVHGVRRFNSASNSKRIDQLRDRFKGRGARITVHNGDLTDLGSLIRIIQEVQPDEIYNLAAQSHVGFGFSTPEQTADVTGQGALRMLEALRILGMERRVRLFQASTSELFGNPAAAPQTEATAFAPRNAYGVAKLYAHWIAVNYRQVYGMFTCTGIMYNHESPQRSDAFVTRKVTRAAARISMGLQGKLLIGNLDARRDWGHARDYVEAMWLMLQQDTPDDYVLSTGETHAVRDLCSQAFASAGIPLYWVGEGAAEKGIHANSGRVLVEVDPSFFRPLEETLVVGDAGKAERKLGWKPRHTFTELVCEMVDADLAETRNELMLAAAAAEVRVGGDSMPASVSISLAA